MIKEEETKGSLYYYREEDKHRIIANELKEYAKKFVEVTAPAMQNISPMLILDHGGKIVHPFINIESDKNIFKEIIPKESKLNLVFEKKEIISEESVKKSSKCGDIDMVKPEDENQEKRHFDKFNLMKGFVFSHDTMNTFEFTHSEDYDEADIGYENLNDKLKKIFGIKI